MAFVVPPATQSMYGPQLDVDLSIEVIRNPEQFPRVSASVGWPLAQASGLRRKTAAHNTFEAFSGMSAPPSVPDPTSPWGRRAVGRRA